MPRGPASTPPDFRPGEAVAAWPAEPSVSSSPRWLTALRSRLLRTFVPPIEAVRAAIGLRRGVQITEHGRPVAYYKELSSEPLSRALSRRGRGHKDYRVTFADGSKQIIRCSPTSCFADLMGPADLLAYTRHASLVRPGSRVLDLAPQAMSSGYAGRYLAGLAGAAGAVVCLIRDAAGAAFADKRYAGLNLSLESVAEVGALEVNIAGEVEGAFDAIFALEPVGMPLPSLVRELARTLRIDGHLVLGTPIDSPPLHAEYLEALGLREVSLHDDARVLRKFAV